MACAAVSVAVGASQAAKAANYYIDPNYSGTEGAAYTSPVTGVTYTAAFNNIVAALDGTTSISGKVPSGSAGSPNILYFAPGVYNTAYTAGNPSLSPGISLQYSQNYVSFVGLTGNANDVVITSTLDSFYKVSGTTIGTTGSATIQLKGNGFSAENMTFANSTDTPYIATESGMPAQVGGTLTGLAESPSGTFPTVASGGTAQTANEPAVAVLLQGDEQVFNNVKLEGYQDTLYDKGGRALFTNSYLTGDVDSIFATGTAVFKTSTINLDSDHSGGDIFAPSTTKTTSNGFVLLNTTITGNSTADNPVTDPYDAGNLNPTSASSMYLGRPWNTQTGGDAAATLINTQIASVGGTSIIKAAGWSSWNTTETSATNTNNGGGNVDEDARFAQYNSTDLTTSAPLGSTWQYNHNLTASQAAAYTVPNIFASEPWYGYGYPSADTDTIGNTGASAAGLGSSDPTNPFYSWPAYWGDRNINDQGPETATLENDPGSYSNPGWTVTGTNAGYTLNGSWDATSQVNALPQVPEPATLGLLAVSVLVPLARRPRRR
jgi:pectin methylesterase-like acyl-CoA thioesterase